MGLRTYKPIRRKTPLKPISEKGKAKAKVWENIFAIRLGKLYIKYGWHICEYCGQPGRRNASFNRLDGHHIIHKSLGGKDTPDNCFVCHRLCHDFIQLNHIDVTEFKKVSL